MLVELRLEKDWGTYSSGETVLVDESRAKELKSSGFTSKKKKKKKKKTEKETLKVFRALDDDSTAG